MAEQFSHSNPDPVDLELARYLEQNRGENQTSYRSDDPLLPSLEEYKSRAIFKNHIESDSELWESINRQINPDKSRLLELKPVYWRVAAVLLTGVILTIAYLNLLSDHPVLLAESEESMIELVLTDGSDVTLRPHTRLYKLTETGEEQSYEVDGEAYFQVEHVPERTFSVYSDEARIQVTGTAFSFSTWSGRTRVFLEEGAVLFSKPDGTQTVELFPGQTISTLDGRILAPETGDRSVYLSWLQNELVLDRRTFSDVADELKHHFDIRITIEESLQNIQLSGTLFLDHPDSALRDITISIGAELERIETGHYLIYTE